MSVTERQVPDGLDAAIDGRLAIPPADGANASQIPGGVFFTLFADRRLGAREWTAAFMKLRGRPGG